MLEHVKNATQQLEHQQKRMVAHLEFSASANITIIDTIETSDGDRMCQTIASGQA